MSTLTRKQLLFFYNDYANRSFKDKFLLDYNYIGKIKKDYTITYNKKPIYTFTSNRNFDINDDYCIDIIINYILSDATIVKSLIRIIRKKEANEKRLVEFTDKSSILEKELEEKLEECFIQFNEDIDCQTSFEIKFPQVRSWKWYNECRDRNLIRIDSMFELMEIEITSEMSDVNIPKNSDKLQDILEGVDYNSSLIKKFVNQIDFIINLLDYTLLDIRIRNFNILNSFNDRIHKIEINLKVGTTNLNYNVDWNEQGSGYTNLLLKE